MDINTEIEGAIFLAGIRARAMGWQPDDNSVIQIMLATIIVLLEKEADK